MKKCELVIIKRGGDFVGGERRRRKNIKKRGLKFFFVLYSMNEQSKDGNRLNKFFYASEGAFGIRK